MRPRETSLFTHRISFFRFLRYPGNWERTNERCPWRGQVLGRSARMDVTHSKAEISTADQGLVSLLERGKRTTPSSSHTTTPSLPLSLSSLSLLSHSASSLLQRHYRYQPYDSRCLSLFCPPPRLFLDSCPSSFFFRLLSCSSWPPSIFSRSLLFFSRSRTDLLSQPSLCFFSLSLPLARETDIDTPQKAERGGDAERTRGRKKLTQGLFVCPRFPYECSFCFFS